MARTDDHSRRSPVPACPVEPGLPGCDTGPGGRLAFVVRELRSAWRGRRRREPRRVS